MCPPAMSAAGAELLGRQSTTGDESLDKERDLPYEPEANGKKTSPRPSWHPETPVWHEEDGDLESIRAVAKEITRNLPRDPSERLLDCAVALRVPQRKVGRVEGVECAVEGGGALNLALL